MFTGLILHPAAGVVCIEREHRAASTICQLQCTAAIDAVGAQWNTAEAVLIAEIIHLKARITAGD